MKIVSDFLVSVIFCQTWKEIFLNKKDLMCNLLLKRNNILFIQRSFLHSWIGASTYIIRVIKIKYFPKMCFCQNVSLFFLQIHSFLIQHLVMGQTPFYRTLNELELHFMNIERTQTCSSIDDQRQTPKFWLRANGHRTLNLKGLY